MLHRWMTSLDTMFRYRVKDTIQKITDSDFGIKALSVIGWRYPDTIDIRIELYSSEKIETPFLLMTDDEKNTLAELMIKTLQQQKPDQDRK